MLKRLYPHYRILRQHTIKHRRATLFLDYYIPQAKVAFEVDGRQHEEYVSFFHKDRQGFEDSKYRDSIKEDWCSSRGVKLIRIKHYEKINITEVKKKLAQEEGY